MYLLRELLFLILVARAVCSDCGNHYGSEMTVRTLSKDSIPNSVLWVTCNHNSTAFELSSVPSNCRFPSIATVRFDYCVLTGKLRDHLARLGVNSGGVHTIALSAPKVDRLDSALLEGFANLTSFITYNGNISTVTAQAFAGAPNLERIILHENRFKTLPPSVFRNLARLKVLTLTRDLETLPPDLFSKNVNLEILHLYKNRLESLPVGIFRGLRSLKTLSVSSNRLTLLDDAIFADCVSLKSVDLKKNELVNVTELLFTNCPQLKAVDLSHNQIKSLPETVFHSNTALTDIRLGNNLLTNLPEKLISPLINLENITLSQNMITSVPNTFINNNNAFIRFDMRGNSLASLPTNFFSKSHIIKIIDLGNNNLTSLPDMSFAECLSLEELRLDGNDLSSIGVNQFPPSASNLKEINLSKNKFSLSGLYQYGGFVLANQVNLNSIDISYNTIEQMPYALYTLSKLNRLNLEYNNITYFSFQFLSEIITREVTINLKNNSIRTISAKVLFPMQNSAQIMIAGNPLHCDCNMFDFADFLRGNKLSVPNVIVTNPNELRCVQPGNMNGQPVNKVNVNNLTCQIPASNASQCSKLCDCTVQPSLRRILVDCAHRNLTAVPPLVMRRPAYALAMDLSWNSLVSLNFSHPSFSTLTNLSLASNAFNTASMQALTSLLPMDQLQFLNLSGNTAASLEEGFFSSFENSSLVVDLGGSNWKCDCDLRPLHIFLQTKYTQIYNIRQVYCSGYNKPLVDLTLEDLCIETSKLITIILVSLVVVIIAVLATVTFLKYRTALRVLLYSKGATRWLVTEKDLDADKQYDAFLSYSHEDEDFINETLVPGLEQGDPKYKVCLHYRDWRAGELIQTQILESVANSRRTIVVLSTNFITSVWGKMEFRVAHQKALKDNTNRVIVIVYGEMPQFKTLDDELKHYVSTRTYLKYDNARFWDNLRYAMPHKADGTKRNHIKLENVRGHG